MTVRRIEAPRLGAGRFGPRVTLGVASAVLVPLCAACVTFLSAPPAPIDPVVVHLVDFGYHTALFLPAGKDELVGFSFGDWDWFALGRNDPWHGFLALAFPTPGALGRVRIRGEDRGALESGVPGARVYSFTVERERAVALLGRLEARYESSRATEVRSREYGTSFVRDPGTYSCLRNCNTVVVGWLAELGCRVRGPGWFAAFRLEEAPGASGGGTRPR